MQNRFRIGKISGIQIKINWSWILIFILVSWNLTSMFGQAHPDWTIFTRFFLAIAAAVLFFSSLIAHELAHSLAARSKGVPVRGITMHFFGGVSNIQRHPPSPRAEFIIAAVGPLTSIALGGVFTLLAFLLINPDPQQIVGTRELISTAAPIPTLLLWLGPVNLLLGFFNMIPGFPLDGGRIFRSILWGLLDDLTKATRWASLLGQGIAWLMIGSGIAMAFGLRLPVFGTGFLNGLWLAFIGWFLSSASVQSYQKIMIQDLLEGVPVRKMARKNPPTVHPQISIDTFINQEAVNHDAYAYPVVENGKVVGMITLEDARQVPDNSWASTRVDQVMTPKGKIVSLGEKDDAARAFNKINQNSFRQIPILDKGRLMGLLRRKDIIRWLALESDLPRVAPIPISGGSKSKQN